MFNQGCSIHKWLPVASEYCVNSAGNPGVDIDWYAGDKFHGKPVVTQQRNHTDLFLWDSAPIENVGPEWSAIVKMSLMPTVSGKHSISFMSVGPGKLYVHGQSARAQLSRCPSWHVKHGYRDAQTEINTTLRLLGSVLAATHIRYCRLASLMHQTV